MERTATAQVKVVPHQIGRLNECLRKAKHVAVQSIDPIYSRKGYMSLNSLSGLPLCDKQLLDNQLLDKQVIEALRLSLEGPPKHLSYMFRLLDDAGLKFHRL